MAASVFEIKVRGKAIKVPSARINDYTVIVSGKWLKMAAVYDEDWLEGVVVIDPELFVAELKRGNLKADILTFTQKIPKIKPMYDYPMEWDNVAAIPITSYQDWWERVSSGLRKDINRANKRGVVVKEVQFNDELIQGIKGIHDEDPIRQGVPFSHYKKGFDEVKKGYGTYLDRSEFIGAYYGKELIGIIKIVYVGELACFMEIISKTRHFDKRPTNALVAKSVEIAEKRGKTYLTYGKYYYGNKKISSLTDFKHRSGFEHILYPRYYVPLTLKGRLSILLKLHLGLHGILPSRMLAFLVALRVKYYQRKGLPLASVEEIEKTTRNEKLPNGQQNDS
jgi:hypothetical protein